MKYFLLVICLCLFNFSISMNPIDNSSLSNIRDIKQTQIYLKLKVDFKEKR